MDQPLENPHCPACGGITEAQVRSYWCESCGIPVDEDWPAHDPGTVYLPVVATGGEATRRMESLISIAHDLQFALACVQDLLEHLTLPRNHDNGIIGGRGPHIEQALYTAALISYARCFATGRRIGLSEADIEPLGPGAVETHRHYMKVRDQHLAHQVLPMEQVKVGVVLSSHDPSEAEIVGVSQLSARFVTDAREGLQRLSTLITTLLERSVILMEQTDVQVRNEARLIGIESLLAQLPMGMAHPSHVDR